MEEIWKAMAMIVLTIILGVTIGKTEKDIAIVLSAAACCMTALAAMRYLSEVIGFLWELGNSAEYQNLFMNILLKITGVALMTELTGVLSSDAGNNALSKAIEILGTSAILFLSLPLFETFFSTIQEIIRML